MTAGAEVFISDTSDTKSLAEELTRALEGQGLHTWVDFRDLRPQERLREQLERAVGSAEWILFLIGSDSQVTPMQDAERSVAVAGTWADRQKKVLPVVVGAGDLPPFLRSWAALRIDSNTETSALTALVLHALKNAHRLEPPRDEWRRRLDEIVHAAEQLRAEQTDAAPILPN